MSRLKPFALGLLGMLAALAGWHLYQDHLLIDAVRVNIEQSQRAKPPAPPVTP